VACDATARLYDVDEDSVIFTKLQKTENYDQGTIKFRARKGKLIDLNQLHESIWATRLSGGTRSGLISLEVTAIGQVVTSQDKTVLQVAGSDALFELDKHPDEQHATAFSSLGKLSGEGIVKVTGVIDDYQGRWPSVLATKPKTPRRILVTRFEVQEALLGGSW
jgi:hypothetical protein